MSAIENINPRIQVETVKSSEVTYSRIKDTSTSSIVVIPYTVSKIGENSYAIESVFVRDHYNQFDKVREVSAFVINSDGCESESDACKKFVSRSLAIPESKIDINRILYTGELNCNISSFNATFTSFCIDVTNLKSQYNSKYELNSLDNITINSTPEDLPNDMIMKVPYQTITSGKYADILLNASILNLAANLTKVASVEKK